MSWRLTFLAAVAIVAIASVAIAAQGGGSKNVVLCANKQGGGLGGLRRRAWDVLLQRRSRLDEPRLAVGSGRVLDRCRR